MVSPRCGFFHVLISRKNWQMSITNINFNKIMNKNSFPFIAGDLGRTFSQISHLKGRIFECTALL